MTLLRRSPLMSGFGDAPAFTNRQFRPFRTPGGFLNVRVPVVTPAARTVTAGPNTPAAPPKPSPAAPPKPSPAQVAGEKRAAAMAYQRGKPAPTDYTREAPLSQQARAEAQDRLTSAAVEYEMFYGGGGAGMEQSMQTQFARSEVSPMEAASMMTGGGGAGITSETVSEVLPEMNATAKARAAFITWLRDTNPEAYRAAISRASSGASLGDTEPAATGFNWNRFLEAATAATTAVFQTKAQRDMLKVNIERARAGLPPMDTSFAAPVIRTQFDVSPEIAQSLQQSAQAGMMNIALIGGAGLLAFLLLRK